MNRALVPVLSLLPLVACAPGEAVLTVWGEAYIEQGIPSEDFADGCSVVFERFDVALAEVAVLDRQGEVEGQIAPVLVDLVQPGPVELGRTEVAPVHYDTVLVRVVPLRAVDPSVRAVGTLTCPSGEVAFDWSFSTDTTYACEPADLTVPAGGEATAQVTIHGDHLFYDALAAEDAEVRGEIFVQADADDDGDLTEDELAATPIAPTGYDVGPYADVTDLLGFVSTLTRTVGHIDGEGHCQVDP